MRASATYLSLAYAGLAAAHGHVNSITADGVTYKGWDPAFAYQNPVPKVAGWTAQNLDNGFVSPDSFGSGDIICHKGATPGQAYVDVKAGSTITLTWNTWPASHAGPITDYLAACNGECTTANKGSLSFAKVAQSGYKSGSNPGKWVTDDLISNNFKWNFKVPSNLKAGNYVLRHEIIGLHAAGQANGAQAYPQCINLRVSGGGSAVPSGVPGTSLYRSNDPGIIFSLYTSFTSYPYPGPALWSGGQKKRHARDISA